MNELFPLIIGNKSSTHQSSGTSYIKGDPLKGTIFPNRTEKEPNLKTGTISVKPVNAFQSMLKI